MIQNYLSFLSKLKANNNREWFTVHKKEYDSLHGEYLVWIENILQKMKDLDDALQFLSVKDCVFRINRDVRFTNDKSPYKSNLSGIFSNSGKSGYNSGYYFEIDSSGEMMVGGGQYYFHPKDLWRVRQLLVEDASPLRKVFDNPEFQKTFGGLTGEQVKTSPRGFSLDDPNMDLLKFKNYVTLTKVEVADLSDDQITNIIVSKFKVIKPLIELLRRW